MSKVLTTKEIDQLLQDIASGGESQDKVEPNKELHNRRIRIYDFQRPDKLLKSDVRNIMQVFDNVSISLSSKLSKVSGKKVSLHVCSIDQLTHEEFYRSVPLPSKISVLKWNDYLAELSVDPRLVFSFLGEDVELNDDLSEQELKVWRDKWVSVMIGAIQKSLSSLNDGMLKHSIPTKIKDVNFISDYNISDLFPLHEMICLVSIEARIGGELKEAEGLIELALPWKLAKEMVYIMENGKKPKVNTRGFVDEGKIAAISVPVEAKLGSTQRTIKELADLEEGTILELDRLAGENIDITVDGKTIAKGEVVVIDENYGIRVTEVL